MLADNELNFSVIIAILRDWRLLIIIIFNQFIMIFNNGSNKTK